MQVDMSVQWHSSSPFSSSISQSGPVHLEHADMQHHSQTRRSDYSGAAMIESHAARASSSSHRQKSRHQCQLCEKSYERFDHLSRHLRSHENTRPFQCARCQKAFNRLDLLKRHVGGHQRASHQLKAQTTTRKKERTAQACGGCIVAKVKCEDQKPCKRCRMRDIVCAPLFSSATYENRSESADMQSPQSIEEISSPSIHVGNSQHPRSEGLPAECPSTQQMSRSCNGNTHASRAVTTNQMNTPLSPSQHIDPQLQGFTYPRVQSILPRGGDFSSSHDLGMDLTGGEGRMSLDDLSFQLDEPFSLDDFLSSCLVPTAMATDNPSPATSIHSLRADAFQSSPWVWNPRRNRSSFSYQEDYSFKEEGVRLESALPTPEKKRCLPKMLDSATRDKIFKLVLDILPSEQDIPTFPSEAILACAMEAFFIQETETLESMMTPNMFCLSTARPELILAIIAAGSVTANNESLRKMGRAFQDVARIAVAELWERDNSSTRDLQIIQAYMLWLRGSFCYGYRRSMEISSAFFQPIYTLLIKSNAFIRSNHISVQLYPGYSLEAVEPVWKDWLRKESFKRLAIQAFLHDSRVSLTNLRNPLVSYSQIRVTLPSSRELWLAPDCRTWANLVISSKTSMASQPPLLVDIFASIDLLKTWDSTVDVYICYLASLHAVAAQVWEYKQRAALAKNTHYESDEDELLLNIAYQKHLYKKLTKLRSKSGVFGRNSPEVILLAEFLMMILNVSLDDIQSFAGKDDGSSAREIVPSLKEWCQTKDARTALWHAGQVLRAAKSFRQSTLGVFNAVAVYFASLTLWVYGLMISENVQESKVNTSMYGEIYSDQEHYGQHESTPSSTHLGTPQYVIIDGEDATELRLFIMFNQGQPCLSWAKDPQVQEIASSRAPFCNLWSGRDVMINAAAIIESTYPQGRTCIPPIVSSLLDLMKRLGELSAGECNRSNPNGSLSVVYPDLDMEALVS